MISVLIPARNASAWIEESVRSVVEQSVPPSEILVADDASTDGTAELLDRLDFPNVRVLRTASRMGISWQLNRLVAESKGRWIARMDADDVSEPDRFATQIPFMESRGLAVCGTWSRRFGCAQTVHRFATEDPEIKAGLLFSVPFCHPTVVFDRDRLGDGLRYDSDFDLAEDYHLWIRLRHRGTYGNVPRELLRWRMHSMNAGTASESSSIQKAQSRRIRDHLLGEYGLALSPEVRAALEDRCQATVLDRVGNDRFLSALQRVRELPGSVLPSPDSTRSRILGGLWNLSCLLSAWTVPGTARQWWQGCLALRSSRSPDVAAKIILKQAAGRLRLR